MLKPRLSSDRLAPRAVAAVVVLVGVGLVMSAACVSSGQYKSLQEERDAIAGRNHDLQGQVSEANQKYEALQQEKSALEQQKDAVESEKEAKQQKSTYDGLLASLKKELEAGQIQVQQMRDGLSVNVAQEILFASGSAALDKSGLEILQRVADQLK